MEESVLILVSIVRLLRIREIPVVKVQWRHHLLEDPTWEIEREREADPVFSPV